MEENLKRTFRNQNDRSRSNDNEQNQGSVLGWPYIDGYMSVDASRNYCSDLSGLKFITSIRIPQDNLPWDLNRNIEQAVKRTTYDNDKKLHSILKFLLDQRKTFENTFITYRHVLFTVMYSAIHKNEPVCIRACLYKDNIYLVKIHPASSQIKWESESLTDQEKVFHAWGYKFEQYLASDHPAHAPNIDKPVVENEGFSLFFRSKIEDHKLFYGAQVHGLLATDPTSPPPDTNDVEEKLEYLRQHHYVELKTNKEILTERQENSFKCATT